MDYIRKMVVCLICFVVMATVICIRVSADSADDIVTNAKGSILIDADSGKVLYSKNADMKLQMASTTKIMSAILTIESGDLDTPFTVDSDAIRVEGSSMGLLEGDTVTKRTLCYGMLLPSGNDAANAASVAVAGNTNAFVEMMNNKAKEIGLSSTRFVTPSGLDDYTDEHYSTAADMAKLTAYAIKNEIFCEICSTHSISLDLGGRSVWLNNTNKLLQDCEGVFGVKTGFTNKAGRCLVSACKRDGITLICVTLGDSTDWIDHKKLFDYGYKRLERVDLGGEDYRVPLVGGVSDITTLTSEPISITLEKGDSERIEKKVLLPQFIYQDETGTEPLGQVIYYLDGGVLAVSELSIAE